MMADIRHDESAAAGGQRAPAAGHRRRLARHARHPLGLRLPHRRRRGVRRRRRASSRRAASATTSTAASACCARPRRAGRCAAGCATVVADALRRTSRPASARGRNDLQRRPRRPRRRPDGGARAGRSSAASASRRDLEAIEERRSPARRRSRPGRTERAGARPATSSARSARATTSLEIAVVDEIFDEAAARGVRSLRGTDDGHDPHRLSRPRPPGLHGPLCESMLQRRGEIRHRAARPPARAARRSTRPRAGLPRRAWRRRPTSPSPTAR